MTKTERKYGAPNDYEQPITSQERTDRENDNRARAFQRKMEAEAIASFEIAYQEFFAKFDFGE